MLPRAINSTTAADLARATIVELAVNVYENALATAENAQFALEELGRYLADVTRADTLVAQAIAAATTAQEEASQAEQAKARAIIAENIAEQNAEICRQERAAADAAANRAVAATDGKLDVDTSAAGHARVYAVSRGGGNFLKFIANEGSPENRALVQYQDNGNIVVNTPTANVHAVNKGYVDGLIADLRADLGV